MRPWSKYSITTRRTRTSLTAPVLALVLAACSTGGRSAQPDAHRGQCISPSVASSQDDSTATVAIPSAALSALARHAGVPETQIAVHAAARLHGSLGVVATVNGGRQLLQLFRVGDGYEVSGSTQLLDCQLFAGGRVFAVGSLNGPGPGLVGGYVDPEMDEWQIIDRAGRVAEKGPTTPAFISKAPATAQLRVLNGDCATYARPVVPPPVTDAQPASSAEVAALGSQFMSLVGHDDVAASALGAYGPRSSWFPRQLAQVLQSNGFDVSTADEGADDGFYSLHSPGQSLRIYVGTVKGSPTVLDYDLLGDC